MVPFEVPFTMSIKTMILARFYRWIHNKISFHHEFSSFHCTFLAIHVCFDDAILKFWLKPVFQVVMIKYCKINFLSCSQDRPSKRRRHKKQSNKKLRNSNSEIKIDWHQKGRKSYWFEDRFILLFLFDLFLNRLSILQEKSVFFQIILEFFLLQ